MKAYAALHTSSIAGAAPRAHAQADQRPATSVQRQAQAALDASPRQVANRTGLPDALKAGVESLSGHSLDDVQVHYNSARPAQLQAHAYAQGTAIHLAPGQERHLPHEAWHVAQQKQGRVRPTMQLKDIGIGINDNSALEAEADAMGARASAHRTTDAAVTGVAGRILPPPTIAQRFSTTVQRVSIQDVFDARSEVDLDLVDFMLWLEARAGKNEAAQNKMLEMMNIKEVAYSVKAFIQQKEAEKSAGPGPTIDDVINDGGTLDKVGKQVDQHLLSLPQISGIIAQKMASGTAIQGDVFVVNDAAFFAQYWAEFVHLNGARLTPASLEHFKLRQASRVDRVEGFHSVMNGRIYLRIGNTSIRLAIHEGIHKYSAGAFQALLGHPLNEGATDYLTEIVCQQGGIKDSGAYYVQEKKLLKHVMKGLGISKADLLAAYFNDNLSDIRRKLVSKLGQQGASVFQKEKDAQKAFELFDTLKP